MYDFGARVAIEFWESSEAIFRGASKALGTHEQ
jgi:hypothetical protein